MFSLKSLCKYIVSDLFKCVGITEHDIKIIDNSFYYDILLKKSLGVGEGYMNQKFTTNNLDVLLEKLTRLNHLKITDIPFRFSYIIVFGYFWIIKLYEKIAGFLFNFQSIEKSLEVAEIHYNLPNILYDNMLGETKLYSCAYFKDCESLTDIVDNFMKHRSMSGAYINLSTLYAIMMNHIEENYTKYTPDDINKMTFCIFTNMTFEENNNMWFYGSRYKDYVKTE